MYLSVCLLSSDAVCLIAAATPVILPLLVAEEVMRSIRVTLVPCAGASTCSYTMNSLIDLPLAVLYSSPTHSGGVGRDGGAGSEVTRVTS